ncbi:MAG: nitrate/nitrite transport system permease protein, partial [Shewanella sp.]
MNSLYSIAQNRLIERGNMAVVMLKIAELSRAILLPFIGIAIFLALWAVTANSIETS